MPSAADLLSTSRASDCPKADYAATLAFEMPLSRDEVLHVARLARIGLTGADVEKFQSQLSTILDNFEALRQIDTTDVEPTTYTLPLENVMAADEPIDSLGADEVLANAPLQQDGYLRVRAVLDE
jgi:aspartyl-tRNA(Asn)/glutamyl-tRNA(Gln) amidotransferase subunit C